MPPVNPKQIAEYCEWIYDHPQEASKLGKNGQKRAETYYQIHQFIEQYADLYEGRGYQLAGIGFKLEIIPGRLFLFRIKAYTFAGLVTSGPWLVVIGTIALIQWITSSFPL